MNFRNLLFCTLAFSFSLSIGACKKEEFEGMDFRVFTIPKGQHDSKGHFISLKAHNRIKFKAVFDSSAVYPTQSVETRGINKLYGFSDCKELSHMEESARFGWEWYNNQLEISAFVHKDGAFKFKFITAVPLNEKVDYTVDSSGNQYTFTVQAPNQAPVSVTMDRGCEDDGHFGDYRVWPYFGGKETAPHEIKILIKEDKRY